MKYLRNHARSLGAGRELREQEIVEYRSSNRSTKVVYFLRRPDGVLKIGSTGNLKKRIAGHDNNAQANGYRWTVLAAVHGTVNEEHRVQSYFSSLRLIGPSGKPQKEYFRPEPTLLRYVRWLRDQYFVEVEEEWGGHVPTDLEVVGYEGWGPSQTRTKPPVPIGPLFGDSGNETEFHRRTLTGDDYYSPAPLVALVREVMGSIDLDPASHPVANREVRAKRFYGRQENGLVQPWYGNVWLNPPFSEWPEFAAKLLEELAKGKITQAIALASAPTLTAKYITDLLRKANAICLLVGRMEFWGPLVDEGSGAGASSGHAILYYGPNSQRLDKVFGQSAVVLFPRPA